MRQEARFEMSGTLKDEGSKKAREPRNLGRCSRVGNK